MCTVRSHGGGAIINTALQNAESQHVRGLDVAARYTFELSHSDVVKLETTATYLDSDEQLSPG